MCVQTTFDLFKLKLYKSVCWLMQISEYQTAAFQIDFRFSYIERYYELRSLYEI